jgi:hypothetical protein
MKGPVAFTCLRCGALVTYDARFLELLRSRCDHDPHPAWDVP